MLLSDAYRRAIILTAACITHATSSFHFLPKGFLRSEDEQLIRSSTELLRNHTACLVEYSRHGGGHRAADRPMGGVLVLPVHERRVPIAAGFRAHLDRAMM